MGTIADKLLYLSGTKDAIKAAIESMGQSVSSSATFRSFADLIKNISKDATATAANILSGKTAYVGGAKVTGTMANNGNKTAYIENNGESVTLSEGYYSGGSITADITNLTAANIKSGVTVGGVAGTFTSDATATAADIASGKTAYANGAKVIGTAEIEQLISTIIAYSSDSPIKKPKIVVGVWVNSTGTYALRFWRINDDDTTTVLYTYLTSGITIRSGGVLTYNPLTYKCTATKFYIKNWDGSYAFTLFGAY